jgi:hypothetical protein
MKPPVLDVTRLTARRAIRAQNRVIVGLDGDYRLLQASQDLLRLSLALTMNIGPLVLTNSGPPPGVFDLLSRA